MADPEVDAPQEAPTSSIIELAQELVRIPSRGGIDDYTPIVERLEAWMSSHRLEPTRLMAGGRIVGVTAEIAGARPGPTYVLDATLDTASFGDPATWTRDPVSGDIEDGWLHGRGAADSKTGLSIFAHLAAHLDPVKDRLAGRVILLFDGDEHSGSFSGALTFFEQVRADPKIDALMIGYPGSDRIVVGGRGFVRFKISVVGQAAHSGSAHRPSSNAVAKAALLIGALAELDDELLDRRVDDFDVPPQVTVTSVSGGEDFSMVPDLCRIGVDVRLTPSFRVEEATAAIHKVVADHDRLDPERSSVVETIDGWPPFHTPDTAPFVRALRRAAESVLARSVPLEVVGPSNIGNYAATMGIPAVAGFGVVYRNIHAPNECIEVASVDAIYRAYSEALFDLLSEPDPAWIASGGRSGMR